MAYLASDKIKVFPSIGRTEIDADAELMNEGNISNIVRSLCRERKSYVLSKTWAAPFEFVIYGFYFKVTDISSLPDKSLYAHITLKENTGNYQLLTISNSTVSDNSLQILDQKVSQSLQFQGVLFDDKTSGGTYTLQLLDDAGNVPATSLLHVKSTEILDGGSSNYISTNFTTGTLTANSATITTSLTASANITAPTFVGSLSGNFTTSRTFTFSGGDISGSNSSNSGNYTVSATINNGAVTNDKIKDGTIKTEKLGFNLNMTLSVTGDDSEHKTLTISLPTLNNK